MNNSNKRKTRKRDKMDDKTAIAFAIDCFVKSHPQESEPEWISRCTAISSHWDDDDNYIIHFCVTPIVTNDAVSYFEVSVNPATAETIVLLDTGLSMYSGEELQGFDGSLS